MRWSDFWLGVGVVLFGYAFIWGFMYVMTVL